MSDLEFLKLESEVMHVCQDIIAPSEAIIRVEFARRIARAARSLLAEAGRLRLLAREVTCVWCGHQFQSTLQSQAEHLYDHAKTCEKHPVHKAEADRDRLLAAAKAARLELMHGGFWSIVDQLDAAIGDR